MYDRRFIGMKVSMKTVAEIMMRYFFGFQISISHNVTFQGEFALATVSIAHTKYYSS